MPSLEWLNALPETEARAELTRCCGAGRWVQGMLVRRPFASRQALLDAATEVWAQTGPEDWLEAFSHHPRIGDMASLRAKFAATRQWSAGEQSGVEGAGEQVLFALAAGNTAYEQKFGHIFIVCATGRSAVEMLEMLQARLENDPVEELRFAAGEQARITHLRLEKLLK